MKEAVTVLYHYRQIHLYTITYDAGSGSCDGRGLITGTHLHITRSGARARASMICDTRGRNRELHFSMLNPYTIENIITVPNYVEALKVCMKNVGYKLSVQDYVRHGLIHIADTINTIHAGIIPAIQNPRKVRIKERGHERIITPIRIEDRITQRVLCDYALIPLIKDRLIYDNGASTKGKGTKFSRDRLSRHLEEAKRRWGADHIYALKFDFKNFFGSIPHAQCFRVLDEIFEDKRMRDLIIGIIESYQEKEIMRIEDPADRERELRSLHNHEKVGICLGSQISQILALVIPDAFDHYVKDKLGVKYYIRHMDDGIILSNDKLELRRIMTLLEAEAAKYGLAMNTKKTMIVPLTKGFMFLKVRYQADGNRTVKTLAKSGIVRMRRKLKKYVGLVNRGKMNIDDVYASVQAWLSHSRVAMSYRAVNSMMELYNRLFGGYRITRMYWSYHPELTMKRKAVAA